MSVIVAGSTGSTNYGKQNRRITTVADSYYPSTLISDYPKQIAKGGHPTAKPVGLLEYLIKTYTEPGDTVLDNCMGGGSTGVACVNTRRNFIGIELDTDYFQTAQNRIDSAQAAQEPPNPIQ